MIEVFKILSDKYDNRVSNNLLEKNTSSTTRGHSKKLIKNRARLDIRKYYFTNRVVEAWNHLTEYVTSAETVKSFEHRLDKQWDEHPMKFDYTCDFYCYTEKSEISHDVEDEPNTELEQT
ncbi:hypothetical protein FSP39_021649 [Pinctada imbricata]|uniref:Uncharacterized protein n=1 Tax=Pinctada imbricata TaxID=66713 RepID=A0AA88XJS2_PINIB|nr:hypothetical protein FSP39_021649 [Pinctada imbricata]